MAQRKTKAKTTKNAKVLCRGISRNIWKRGWNRKELLLQLILKQEKKATVFLKEKSDNQA